VKIELLKSCDSPTPAAEALMRKAIAEIRDGTFARRWAAEQAAGSPMY